MSLVKMKGITVRQALEILKILGLGSLYVKFSKKRIQLRDLNELLRLHGIESYFKKASQLTLHFHSLEQKRVVRDTLSNMVKDRLELRSLV